MSDSENQLGIAGIVHSVIEAEKKERDWKQNPIVVAALSIAASAILGWIVWSLSVFGQAPQKDIDALAKSSERIEGKLDKLVDDNKQVSDRVTTLETEMSGAKGSIKALTEAGPRFSKNDGERMEDRLRDDFRREIERYHR